MKVKFERRVHLKNLKKLNFKSKSTPYSDDESISVLDKLTQGKFRIFNYLGQNVPKESPPKWKSYYSLWYALDDGFAIKVFSR